ncbi:hypothetical protein Mapa_005992 [Marchantia paleacea]|nr:hypothetical protein Mapa_005992 [Marchantia paleacea]
MSACGDGKFQIALVLAPCGASSTFCCSFWFQLGTYFCTVTEVIHWCHIGVL